MIILLSEGTSRKKRESHISPHNSCSCPHLVSSHPDRLPHIARTSCRPKLSGSTMASALCPSGSPNTATTMSRTAVCRCVYSVETFAGFAHYYGTYLCSVAGFDIIVEHCVHVGLDLFLNSTTPVCSVCPAGQGRHASGGL